VDRPHSRNRRINFSSVKSVVGFVMLILSD
jgi:hypothetical protein